MNDKSTIRHDTSKRHAHKYKNSSFLHQLVLGRFLDAMAETLTPFQQHSILDFGCGEAFFWQEMQQRSCHPSRLTGIDLRDDALDEARQRLPEHRFLKQDLLHWEPEEKFDLVMASQVLEHLPEPGQFLDKLSELSQGHILLSVPWEPFFRLCNLARGRDILRLGNHPEHINLWGARSFVRFVEKHADIIETKTVFPFLIILCKPAGK